MSEKQLWYGYLEAGEKSSPVLLDHKLDTGDPATLYLFNLARKEILEYKRSIVESKLRELGPGEAPLVLDLKRGYGDARRNFKPRSARSISVSERAMATAEDRAEEMSAEEYDLPIDVDTEADEES